MKAAVTRDTTSSPSMIQEGHVTSGAFFPKPQRDHEKTPLGVPFWGLPHPDIKPDKGIARKEKTYPQENRRQDPSQTLTVCKGRQYIMNKRVSSRRAGQLLRESWTVLYGTDLDMFLPQNPATSLLGT